MNFLFSTVNIIHNTVMENANIIIPSLKDKCGSLWLADHKAILDLNFLIKNNISVIINCTPDIPYVYEVLSGKELNGLKQLETFRIPVQDSLLNYDIDLMEQYFHISLPFILKKLIKEKKNVVINCAAGKQRSAINVALVLFTLIYNDILSPETHIDGLANNIYPIFNELPLKTTNKPELMRNIIKYIIKKRPQAFTYGYRINFKESIEKFLGFKF
jgi:protein-tyrosine phosphatase